MNLSAHITDFLEKLEFESKASQLTIKNYRHYLKRFLLFAGELDPKDIDLTLVKKYRLFLSRYSHPKTKKTLKKATQNYFMIALRSFLRYLARIDILSLSPKQVELAGSEHRSLKVLDHTYLQQLLNAPDVTKKEGIRDRAILETLFSTGLRVSELISLNRDTIKLERSEFEIVGKGGKERIVFISDSAKDWLERYLSARKDTFKPLFIRFQGRMDPANDGEAMRLSSRSIERIVEKYVKALTLPLKPTPQTLRHSYAADLLTKGIDIRSVQRVLGHSHISTTQLYNQLA